MKFFRRFSKLHVGLPVGYLLLWLINEAVWVWVRNEQGGEEGEEAQPGQGQEKPEKPKDKARR